LIIIPKQKIKEDLGCSPDEADCYVMGVWGSQHVQPDEEIGSGRAMRLVPSHIGR
jgi:hypothetical protein